MAEIATTSILGVKYATLAAGFAGGVVSLSFVKELTKPQMFAAVCTGTLTAGYITPLALELAERWVHVTPNIEGAAGFIIGLCAMNHIPGIMSLARRFERDPAGFIKRKGGKE